MGHAVMPEVAPGPPRSLPPKPRVEFRFRSLVLSEPPSAVGRKSATFGVSLVLHTLLVLAIIVLPLVFYDFVPPTSDVLKAFFVAPQEVAPAPPPPPPPAAGPRVVAKAPTAPQPVSTSFTAPIEVPAEIKPEEGLSLGIEGGVPGGVEGGVPGGVVGGVVGGLIDAPPPPRVVRVGGHILAPKLIKKVNPAYPELAINARISMVVIMEAQVDTRGYVKTVKILRGHPLFDVPTIEAVKQWRYQPLLLNGEPTEFILTVTVNFNLSSVRGGGETN